MGDQHHLPGDEEVRSQGTFRHNHYKSQPGESSTTTIYNKGSRLRRFSPGVDSQDFSLGEPGTPRQPVVEGFQGPSYQGMDAVSGPEQARVYERSHGVQHRRSAGARSMLRSRSVDFNFNSSSTDGSVFDYDKAVLGLRGEGEFIGENTVGLRHHTLSKKQQLRYPLDHPQQSDRLKYGLYLGEEQAMSDPSHLIPSNPRSRLSFVLPDRKDGLIHGNWRGHSNDPAQQNEQTRRLLADPSKPDLSSRQTERARSAHFPLSSDSSNQERFIRISLSPRKSSQTSGDQFPFQSDSYPVGHAVLQGSRGQEEEESGFDTAEGDPYDSIVTRIREISSSNYTNAEKLQRVSDLISKSQKGEGRQQTVEGGFLKSAKSTIDLTRSDKFSRNYERGPTRGVVLTNDIEDSHLSERPVDVIYRMKQNIAKSMEDLSSILPSPGSNTSHGRFRSELRMEPVFTIPQRKGDITVVKSGEFKHSVSDIETTKSSPVLTSPGDGGSRTRTFSDVEVSLPRPFTEDDWSHMADGDCEGSTSSKAPRPSGLAIPSSRNFISPSFLRPAMSMQDISSRASLTAANLDLLQELEGNADFGSLNELLNALQAEPVVQMEGAHGNSAGTKHNMDQSVDLSRTLEPSRSKEKKEAELDEKKSQIVNQAASKDIIANFVMYGKGPSSSLNGSNTDAGVNVSHYATSSSTSNTSPSWLVARGFLRQGGSFSTEEEGEANSAVLLFQNKINLNR